VDVSLTCKIDQGAGTVAVPVKLDFCPDRSIPSSKTCQAPKFALELALARITGDLTGGKIVAAPAFAGHIALQEISPRDLSTIEHEAQKTRDPQALKLLALEPC